MESKEHMGNHTSSEPKRASSSERRRVRKEEEMLFTNTYKNRTAHSHRRSKKKHRHSRSHKQKIRKRILLIVIISVVALILGIIGTYFYLYFSGKSELTDSQSTEIAQPTDLEIFNSNGALLYNNNRYTYNGDIVNVLFMGIDETDVSSADAAGSNSGKQTDVLYLISIDSANSVITLTSIPRDIMTDVKVYSQQNGGILESKQTTLSRAYSISESKELGCFNTAEAVRSVFYNIPLTTYYSLEMDGVATINDSLGGIDVISPDDFGTFKKGESYHLEGQQIYSFIETGNASKNSEAQNTYMSELIKKGADKTKGNILFPINLFRSVSGFSCNNVSASKATYLETIFLRNEFTVKCQAVPVDTKTVSEKTQSEVREKEFYEMFLNTFYNKE